MTILKPFVSVIGLWVYILFVIPDSLAQGNTLVRDFNNDKSFDFLVHGMEWQDINWDYVLTDGKTGQRWAYVSQLYYTGPESFISVSKTRNELSESWNRVIKTMEDTLILNKRQADPSLLWAINARIIDPDPLNDSLFDRIVSYKKIWYNGIPSIPANYSYRLGEETASLFEDFQPFDTYYWYYRSHNHKEDPGNPEPEEIQIKREGLKKIKHALIEIHDDQYAWVFMSGFVQTGGPTKLRWPSVEKVLQQDGLVFLQQQVVVGEYAFWVGDLQKGIWARIRNENFDDRRDFKAVDENLVLLDGEGEVIMEITLTDIKDIMRRI
jgi:hypothetical protein